ncbi:MAG TPA: sigma-70 family RNA polymerase sigma factor, partial [Gaiellaceae bacterium]|nr:sigma-70 family RNA polymerase sigma factor [Gaiellaceae bacterium]
MRDDELVTAARAGDPEAFAALVARHRARVAAVVERLVGDEAEDLVQEALLRAYLGLSQLRDSARFGAWLCGIAVNLAKMRLRRRAHEARLTGEPPSAYIEERAFLHDVRDAVDLLPRAQRDVVLMHYVDDLSCEEIAGILDASPGAIRVRLHRARARLREELAPLAPADRRKEKLVMIEVKLEDVLVRVAEDDPTTLVSDHRVVLLKEADGTRLLPIWVGA